MWYAVTFIIGVFVGAVGVVFITWMIIKYNLRDEDGIEKLKRYNANNKAKARTSESVHEEA